MNKRRLCCECSTEPLVKRSACSWGRRIDKSVTWRWSSRCLRWWWRWRRRWWWWRCNWGPNWGLPKSDARLKKKVFFNENETQKSQFFVGNVTVFSDWWSEILHWQNMMPFLVILLVVCLAQDGIKVALFFHRVSLQHLIIVLLNFSLEVIVNYLKTSWLQFVFECLCCDILIAALMWMWVRVYSAFELFFAILLDISFLQQKRTHKNELYFKGI